MAVELEERSSRIARVQNGWIKYQRAEQILSDLEDLLKAPRAIRMQNMLLFGETANGKSTLLNKFVERHKPELNVEDSQSSIPVVLVEAPPEPDEGRLYFAILKSLNAPFLPASRIEKRQDQLFGLLKTVGARMLIIDEIHNFLGGTQNKRQGVRNAIKYLGNQLQIPIVAAGTAEAQHVFHSDVQLRTRFEPVQLQRWVMGEEFQRLLAAFERAFALENPSTLSDAKLAEVILRMTGGTIGEISKLLRKAALHAIESGTERITAGVLADCRYVRVN